MNKVAIESLPTRRLQVLGYRAALLDKAHGIFPFGRCGVRSINEAEELLKKGNVALKVGDDFDLVEEYKRIKHTKGRIIQYPC